MAHVSGNPPWLNKPNKMSPLNAQALERIEVALDQLDGETTTWGEVTDKPTAFPPSGHAGSHASGGSDPITPASIGAVAAQDTGWRLLELINGWTNNGASAAVSPAYRRIGKIVYIRVRNLSGASATSAIFAVLPTGFIPPSADGGVVAFGSSVIPVSSTSTGNLFASGAVGSSGVGAAMSFGLITEQAFPAEPYPSIPA